jgi:hypothetical protein
MLTRQNGTKYELPLGPVLCLFLKYTTRGCHETSRCKVKGLAAPFGEIPHVGLYHPSQ